MEDGERLKKSTLEDYSTSLPQHKDTIQMVVTEIETIMNGRPLTFISSSLKDPEPLTPVHLLHGCRITSLPYLSETREQ